MATLDRNLRKDLGNAVATARREAEDGACQEIRRLAVHDREPGALSLEEKQLRNRLRAHGRQLGDRLDAHTGTQAIERLVGECAYEHWHRLLFARFLAENGLLQYWHADDKDAVNAEPLSLAECRELARERGVDWLVLASDFAQRMLPQIFRVGDPLLEVTLPPETRQELEQILEALPRDVFIADDSLGWVYQFWQAEEKGRVNASETRIGACELPAVTQLFTEDYMVLFLLENTLGAWWAGKHLAQHPALARDAQNEDELRAACSPPGYVWKYLRFTRVEGEPWRPAAGAFEGWPKTAAKVTVLDPCMGSGHFLVFALPILVRMRCAEEGLTLAAAVRAVLRDNLFGLELDPRCTQIAAFNLALAAWRLADRHQALPPLHLACSGLGVNARDEEWRALAGGSHNLRLALGWLHETFRDAPTLGSLLNPARTVATKLVPWSELSDALRTALSTERSDDDKEVGVAAFGLAQAAEILADRFTLVATNVPYLGRGKQDEVLKRYCERVHPEAKADLATCFVERCLDFCDPGGSTAVVTPQNWLFLGTYKKLRRRLLEAREGDQLENLEGKRRETEWNVVARLGPHAFGTITGEVVNVALLALTARKPDDSHAFAGIDVSEQATPDAKAAALRERAVVRVGQKGQLGNPDARITLSRTESELVSSLGDADVGILRGDSPRLSAHCASYLGLGTGDYPHYGRCYWEFAQVAEDWAFQQGTVESSRAWGGREHLVAWDLGVNRVRGMSEAERDQIHNQDQSGQQAWGRWGVAVGLMRDLKPTLYTGERHEKALAALIPSSRESLPALWALCTSPEFHDLVRELDQKIIVANGTLVKIPFDLSRWQQVAAEKYPNGLPKPHSDDPTQWLFNGHPRDSEHPLQVAVARLVGYRWPRQTGSSFPDCPALAPDGLEAHADEDGIVCLTALRDEASAADRLRALLADAYGAQWSPARLNELLKDAGSVGSSLGEWLRESFFERHCAIFHHRPFVWHIWDGLKNGFGALVNYHTLSGPDGEGRRTLGKLIFTYLGAWIEGQRADQRAGVEGSDARVAAAEHLKGELVKILEGEPPYDIFVRWKPVDEQPMGWEPDLNDGVRMNIRPFMKATPLGARGENACILRVAPTINWRMDRGKEPLRVRDEYPWFWGWDEQALDFAGRADFDGKRWNDLHYSLAVKLDARGEA